MYLVPVQLFLIICLIQNFIHLATSQYLHKNEFREDKLNYLYNFLNQNGHKQMCSLLRSSRMENYLTSFEYTLISPTDEAFALIPVAIKHRLINDTEFRLNFIKNHIINGRLFISSITTGQQIMINAVSNNRIHIAAYNNGYVINGAQILNSDLQIEKTPNLAQFVDKPIYLEPTLSFIDYLSLNYKQMLRFIEISGLQNEFLNDKERTFFIPNDEAFRTLPWSVIEQMYNNNTFLKNVLKSHVLNGINYSFGLQSKQYSLTKSPSVEKLSFKTKILQGRNLVFVNDIPIINSDIIIKSGVIHEISKLILPKQLMEECNCLNSEEIKDLPVDREIKNLELFNKDFIKDKIVLYTDDTYNNIVSQPENKNNLIKINSDQNISKLSMAKSTIIPESMKIKYINLHNMQYKSKENQTKNSLLKPMVFYDQNDPSFFTTIKPKIPISYHNNHNYYNPIYNGTLNISSTRRKPKLFKNDINLENHNQQPNYSVSSSNIINKKTNLSSNLPQQLYDPFIPYTNLTLINTRPHFYPIKTNLTSPVISYSSHVYHESIYDSKSLSNQNPFFISKPFFDQNPSFVVNKPILIYEKNFQSTTSKPVLIYENNFQTTTYKPFSMSSPIFYSFPTKTKQGINYKSKFFNDLTTPAPVHFDPTRKPKSPMAMNKINSDKEMNEQNLRLHYLNQDQGPKKFLQTNYQVMDSNLVHKFDQSKKLSNENHKNIIPSISYQPINSHVNRNSRKNRLNQKNYSKPSVISSTLNMTENNLNNSNDVPKMTLLDVIKNPYLMINNEFIYFDMFEHLLNRTNISQLLNSNGKLTLILPTNSAFKKLKDYELEFLKLKRSETNTLYSSSMRKKRNINDQISDESLRFINNLVLNHISPLVVNPDSIFNSIMAKTFSNINLKFSRKQNKLYVNNIPVLATTLVSNGVAYVIDDLIKKNETLLEKNSFVSNRRNKQIKSFETVLNPSLFSSVGNKFMSSSNKQNVIEIIENLPEVSFFTSLVKKSNYSKLLAGTRGTFTVLIPQNNAFNYLSHETIDLLRNSPSFIDKFVGNHIINANFSLNNLIVSPIIMNFNKLPIKIQNKNGFVMLNDTAVLNKVNIPTATGFIHIVTHALTIEPYSLNNVMMLDRKPIFQEPTLQDQLIEISKSQNSLKFMTFFIDNSYLEMIKSSQKNYTILLPTDTAYYSLPENVINKIENNTLKLKTILNYHLVDHLIDFSKLQSIDQLTSFNGLPLHYKNISSIDNDLEKLHTFNSLIGSDSRVFASNLINDNQEVNELLNIKNLIEKLKSGSTNDQISLSGSIIKGIKLIEIEHLNSNKLNKNFLEILFIDRVLYTPKGSIYSLIKSSPMLTILKNLIDLTDIKDEIDWSLENKNSSKNNLTNVNGYTFFAPSNNAFERLGLDIVEQLKKSSETAKVFLMRHLIKKPIFTSSIPMNGTLIENSTGEHLNLQRSQDIIAIEGVVIEIGDITTTNGVVHVIENVL